MRRGSLRHSWLHQLDYSPFLVRNTQNPLNSPSGTYFIKFKTEHDSTSVSHLNSILFPSPIAQPHMYQPPYSILQLLAPLCTQGPQSPFYLLHLIIPLRVVGGWLTSKSNSYTLGVWMDQGAPGLWTLICTSRSTKEQGGPQPE